MQNALFACGLAAAAVLVTPVAHADIFTWTDATGRLNISNVDPPQGVQARRIVQKDLPKRTQPAVAPQSAEVEALKERVAELESEVDRAKQASAPPPVIVVPPVVVAPPPQPTAPPVAYAPPADVAPCDPLMFGCPAFGYPVNVVVVRAPRFRRFPHHDAGRRMHAMPDHPHFGPRRR